MNQDDVERLAERLRGIFPESALLAITPTWAQKGDPFIRLARSLAREGIGLLPKVPLDV
jgi:hypothetical protein